MNPISTQQKRRRQYSKSPKPTGIFSSHDKRRLSKSPKHIITLKPKNMEIHPQNPVQTFQNTPTTFQQQGNFHHVTYTMLRKTNQNNIDYDKFNIRTSALSNKGNLSTQWKTPPPPITNPFQQSNFDQPPQDLFFPSPYIKYKIIPALDDDKCIDVTTIQNPQKKLKKNYLQIWTYHGGPNQQFYFNKASNGKYLIINVSNGFTIQVPESSAQDGTHVHSNPKNQTENQHWQLRENDNGLFEIVSFCGKVLDMEDQSDSKGTRVIQWKRNNGKNQLWKIVPS